MAQKLTVSVLLMALIALAGCATAPNDPGSEVSQSTSPAQAQSPATPDQAPSCCCAKKDDPEPRTRPANKLPDGSIPQLVQVGTAYHAEVVLEKKGVVRINTLGKNQAQVVEVDVQKLEASGRVDGLKGSIPVVFEAVPAAGDTKGKTSQFVGKLPQPLRGKTIFVTVPIAIAGERYRFGFSLSQDPHDDDGMPLKIIDEDERKLYLVPGGKYTEADIKANGRLTASQKFDVSGWPHDTRPKVGEPICPVTLTKANPDCTWIVGGKKYSFCCPPCIDTFVQIAKEQPDQIKDPEAYRKK